MTAFPTPLQAFETVISRWEGLWEDDPGDSGNYAHCFDGTVNLVGTMRGVTPDVYSAWLGIDPATITAAQMQFGITLDVAAEIGVMQFYIAPKLYMLPWSPLTAIVVDIGWGSGVARAMRLLQQLVGADVDGVLGPQTASLVSRYLDQNDIDAACDRLTGLRRDFYLSISQPGAANAKFRQGWINRADWFLSTNPEPFWFEAWQGWTASSPIISSRPAA
jgi:lysozyme family protein